MLAALVLSAALAHAGQAHAATVTTTTTVIASAPTPSVHAALALTAAGATMFWARRLADDTALAARTGREH
ncbi:MAG TPA: hypothetical protein VGO62_14460, partial [Myxococcota bacterium]